MDPRVYKAPATLDRRTSSAVLDPSRLYNYIREVLAVLIVFLSSDGPVVVPRGV